MAQSVPKSQMVEFERNRYKMDKMLKVKEIELAQLEGGNTSG